MSGAPMSGEQDRRAALSAVKLRALAATAWDLPSDLEAGSSVAGASLVDRAGGRAWFLLDDDPTRRLGMALALALRSGVGGLHILVEDGDEAAVLARRAKGFTFDIDVWTVEGTTLTETAPAAPAEDPAPSPEAELYRPVLVDAGLTPVVEGGELIGELSGLEVARVITGADGSAHVEAGVGRFDREAGAMMFAELSETDSLARAVAIVAEHRRPGVAWHQLNQLVPERWLRSVLVARPGLVGASSLAPVGSALPRRNLREDGVATAVGTDTDGKPLVVSCATGVHLDLVAAATDDRRTHAPEARLVLALPERDALPIIGDLAALVAGGAEVITVAETWRELAGGEP